MESEKRKQRRERSQLEKKEQSLHQAMQKWDISSRTQQKQKVCFYGTYPLTLIFSVQYFILHFALL